MELASCRKILRFSFVSVFFSPLFLFPVSNALAQTQCELMPIGIQEEAIFGFVGGETVEELPTGVSAGNYSWLTWMGSPSSPTLANSLLAPGDSTTYQNPDDDSDSVLEVGDWVQGSPGVIASSGVKAALNRLLGEEIVVPVWNQVRGAGNNFDYQVSGFARISLSAYKLTGQGWISFEYLGHINCPNSVPVAIGQSYEIYEDQSLTIELQGQDEDGEPLSFTLSSNPSHGNLSGEPPVLTYIPAVNFNGADSFTFVASDGQDVSEPALIEITVLPVNDAPVTYNQQLEFEEDQALPITLEWLDVDGDDVSFEIVTGVSHGSLVLGAGTALYTPDPNFDGEDSFTYRVNDGELDSNVATVFLSANPVNDAPIAESASFQTLEDEPLDIVLIASDIDGDPLTFSVADNPEFGQLQWLDSSHLIYTPNTEFFGPDSFTFFANDGQVFSNKATIDILVHEKNKAPEIVSLSVDTAEEGTPYTYDVEAQDPNQGDVLSYELYLGPEGMEIVPESGLLTWSPSAQYVNSLQGVNSYCSVTAYDEQYRSLDLVFLADTAGALTVSSPLLDGLSLNLDEQLRNLDVGTADNPNQYGLLGFSDTQSPIQVNGSLLFSSEQFSDASSQLQQGIEGSVDGLSALLYVLNQYPLREEVAQHLFLLTDQIPLLDEAVLNSLQQQLQQQTISLSVLMDVVFECPNHQRVLGIDADNVGYYVANGDVFRCDDPVLISGNPDLLANYADLAFVSGGSIWSLSEVENDGASFAQAMSDYLSANTVSKFSQNMADLVVQKVYLESGNPGELVVIIKNRGLGATGQSTNLTVEGILGNTVTLIDERIISNLGAGEATAITVQLSSSYQFDDIAVHISPLPEEQECVTDNNDFLAPVVNVVVRDAGGLEDSQQYLINVYEKNDAPAIISDPVVSAYIGEEYLYHTIASDPDQGDLARFSLLSAPEGMWIHPGTGKISWLPLETQVGDYTVDVQVTDIAGATALQSFVVSSGYLNHNPDIITSPTTSAQLSQTYFYDVNATDADGDALQYSLLTLPDGAVIDETTGVITWLAGMEGTFSFTVQVSDGQGGFDTQSFDVSVVDSFSNHAPSAFSNHFETPQNQQVDIVLLGEDSDGDVLTYTIVTQPQHGSLSGEGASISYLPDAYYAGEDSFEYTVNDGLLTSVPAVIDITVQDENNPPQIISEPVKPLTLQPASGDSTLVDLSLWTALDFGYGTNQGGPNWGIDSTNTVATQYNNSRGSALLSDFILEDDQIQGSWRVNTSSDDDYMGFVFGWQNKYQYYLFDWKQGSQGAAYRGMTVKKINLAADGSEGTPDLWSTYSATTETLYHNSIGWGDYTDYEFSLTFHPGEFTITVRRGTTVLDSFTIFDDTFGSGQFGFYNLSQARVRYTGFTRETLASRIYEYQVVAIDPDDDVITYSLVDAPEGMSIDPISGLITWPTTSADAGVYEVTLQAEDPYGATSTQSYDLIVVEQVPVIVTSPIEQAVVDQQYAYDVHSYDPNPDDVLSYSLTESPEGMVINVQSGLIEWLPNAGQLGSHPVTIRVTDLSGFYSEQTFQLAVLEEAANTPPEFTSEPPSVANVGELYRYTPQAVDGDGDAITISLLDVPYGMQMFDGETITWVPTSQQVTKHTIVIDANDGRGGVTTQEFSIDVRGVNANQAPQITSVAGQVIEIGTQYEYIVIATDNNGDSLSYQLLSAPEGMQINAAGKVTWLPTEAGFYSVKIRVEDGRGGYAEQSYDIAVYSSVDNSVPAVSSQPITTAYLGTRYEYRLIASDADGDDITYSVESGPDGLQIDTYTGVVSWVPSAEQLGSYQVSLKAYDGRGGSVVQTFTLTVAELSENTPPSVTSEPLTTTSVGENYSYQMVATDANGDSLIFSLDSGPQGMAVDAAGLVTWVPELGQEGLHSIVLSVADGAGGRAAQSFVLAVDDGTGLSGNLAPSIGSVPPSQASPDIEYSYQLMAVDPEGGELAYSLIEGPEGMLVDPLTGLLTWVPAQADIGVHTVTVQVADSDGGITEQQFTLSVYSEGGNRAPVINSQPPLMSKVGLGYQYQIEATDADGDALSYQMVNAPVGATLSSGGLFEWTPDAPGMETIQVFVSDGISSVTQNWTLDVSTADTVLDADILVSPEVADIGQNIQIQVVVTGGAGETSVRATLDGDELSLDEQHSVTTSLGTIGSHEIVVLLEDGYDTSVVRKTLYIRDPNDSTAPFVTFHGLESGQEVTSPIDIVATISDDNLSAWTLQLEQVDGNSEPTELASGALGVTETVIGGLDPTMLVNGQYRLVLEALDESRNTTIVQETVRVTGDLKVGNFSFTVNDLEIPLSGIPIQINRTYDSRRRGELLDFGYGWSLDYQNLKVEESRRPTKGWTINQYNSGPFGAYVNLCVEPLGKPVVTITLPNGDVETFEVSATPQCSFYQVITDVYLEFTPVDGANSTLQQTDVGLLRLSNGNLVELGGDSEPDPNQYVLTTKEGYVYELDQGFGIKRVIDPNGNTLTYTDNGIFHSDGKSVLFERNAAGLITAIIDPAGNRLEYFRDQDNNLITAEDQVQAETTYTYNANHGLVDIIDPLGRTVVKNIYDDDGRLVAQEDGEGNRTEFNHDIEGRLSVVTDRNGHPTTFYYDDEGNVTTTVDALGNTTTFTYDADGNQLSETNPLGQTQSATYNDRRDQLTQTDALGNTIRFEYNTRGQETKVTDAKGNIFTQIYDSLGNLLTVIDAEGNLAANNINAKGHISRTTDALTNTTDFTYYGDGNKQTETDALGNTTSYTYDDNGNVKTETRSRTLVNGSVVSETTVYEYDAHNRVLTTTDPLGHVTSNEYDLAGNLTATVDALGHRVEMDYDAYRRLTETRYPDGTSEQKTYDPEGNLLTDTDRAGRITRYTYDALNRLKTTTYPDNSVSQTEYDAAGRVRAEVDENGNRTEFEYDAAGRRTARIDVQGNRHSYEYDANGNLFAEVDALGHRTEYAYNSLDQRTSSTYHNGSTMAEDFDALSRRTSQTDQAGITTDHEYDELGRLSTVTDVEGNETRYTYDEVGNKLTQTDAEGRTTSWEYDALGRVVARVLPLGQRETFEYDAVGNLIRHTDFNGNLSVHLYDSNNRREATEYQDGVIDSWTYTPTGQIDTATQTLPDTSSRSWHYEYDERDRLLLETQPDGTTLAYQYDSAGNKTRVTVTPANASGYVTAYTYDSLNRLKTVTDHNGQITSYGYDVVGNRTSISHANGTSSRYDYDVLNRLDLLETFDANGALLQRFDYTLDATGRRKQIDELSGRSTQYAYDTLYRLKTETITDSLNGNYSASYQYDKVGNRLYETVNGVQTQYTYDSNDRLTQQGGTSYTYDNNGNTLTETLDGNTSTFNYNAKNQLQSVEKGGNTTGYSYNLNGIRDSKTEGGITTTFIVDQNRDYAQVLFETDGANDTLYSYGDDLLSQTRNGVTSTYHYDGLGSTRALTDSAGTITDSYDYEAFGELLNHTGSTENNYRFTGEQYDPNLNQYYLRARYYNQQNGRFTQQDTWMGNNTDPITLHKYLYANVDPANTIDPTGNFGFFGTGVANTIVGIMTELQVQNGFSILDQMGVVDADVETARNAHKLLGLAYMGAGGVQLLKMLSKKFRKACNSFDGNTLVATEFGLVAIKDIKIGDKVWAYNEETGEKSLQEVVHLIEGEGTKELVDIKLTSGEVITATAGHPFYIPDIKDWLTAGELIAEQDLLGLDGNPFGIEAVDRYSQVAKVYNLTVDNDHTYYVGKGGVLSHNAGECDIWKVIWGKRSSTFRARLIERDTLGRSLPASGNFHAHHIVPIDMASAKLLQEKLALAGIRGNSIENGVWLDSRVHSKGHSQGYVSYLSKQLEGIDDKAGVIMVLREVAEDLVSGKIKVNM